MYCITAYRNHFLTCHNGSWHWSRDLVKQNAGKREDVAIPTIKLRASLDAEVKPSINQVGLIGRIKAKGTIMFGRERGKFEVEEGISGGGEVIEGGFRITGVSDGDSPVKGDITLKEDVTFPMEEEEE
jgi:hypothetical protein